MDYRSTIENGLKEALKKRDAIRVSVFRLLLTAIKNKEVEKIRPLTDEEFFALIKTSIKQHNDSIESFKKGQRLELAEKEEKELEIPALSINRRRDLTRDRRCCRRCRCERPQRYGKSDQIPHGQISREN
jgi:hypothetical protein